MYFVYTASIDSKCVFLMRYLTLEIVKSHMKLTDEYRVWEIIKLSLDFWPETT